MKTRDYSKRKQKISYRRYGYECLREHPFIRIGGKYLEGFDFKVGDFIEVNVEKGKITLSKLPQEYNPAEEQITIRREEIKSVRQSQEKSKGLQR